MLSQSTDSTDSLDSRKAHAPSMRSSSAGFKSEIQMKTMLNVKQKFSLTSMVRKIPSHCSTMLTPLVHSMSHTSTSWHLWSQILLSRLFQHQVVEVNSIFEASISPILHLPHHHGMFLNLLLKVAVPMLIATQLQQMFMDISNAQE